MIAHKSIAYWFETCKQLSAASVIEVGKSHHLMAVKDNGTGVRLSIVKKVVENHNGMIGVESAPGHKAASNIFLPVEP